MGGEGRRTVAKDRWPIVARKTRPLYRHRADRPAIPTRLEDAAERVGAPVHTLATRRAPHGKPVGTPILLPAESRMAVEAVAADRIRGGPIRLDAEAQAVVTIKPTIGHPAPRDAMLRGNWHHDLRAAHRRGRDVGFQGLGRHGSKAKDGCKYKLRGCGGDGHDGHGGD